MTVSIVGGVVGCVAEVYEGWVGIGIVLVQGSVGQNVGCVVSVGNVSGGSDGTCVSDIPR